MRSKSNTEKPGFQKTKGHGRMIKARMYEERISIVRAIKSLNPHARKETKLKFAGWDLDFSRFMSKVESHENAEFVI